MDFFGYFGILIISQASTTSYITSHTNLFQAISLRLGIPDTLATLSLWNPYYSYHPGNRLIILFGHKYILWIVLFTG